MTNPELDCIKLDAEISPAKWKSFFEEACWKDIVNTINLRLVITRDQLEQLKGEEAAEARGEARSLRFLLNLQEIIKQELEPKPQKEDLKDE